MIFNPLLPGIVLMRHMRLNAKMVTMGALMLLPLVAVCIQLLLEHQDSIQFVEGERQGTTVLRPLLGVLNQIHGTAPPGVSAEIVPFQTQPALASLESQWETIQAGIRRLPAGNTEEAHRIAADIRQLVYTVGERSGLLFDPDAPTYFLIDMTLSRIPAWRDQLVRLHEALVNAQPASAILAAADGLAAQQREIQFAAGFLGRHGQGDLPMEKALAASKALEGFARNRVVKVGLAASADDGQRVSQDALAAVTAYQNMVLARTDTLLLARQSALHSTTLWTGAAVTGGLLLLLYLTLSMYGSFVVDFRRMTKAIGRISEGDLQVDCHVAGRDELADTAVLLHRMVERLSATVADVRSNSALVAYAGHHLASSSRDLADRTEQQAANLQQTAASVQQLSATVQQNAATAGEVGGQAIGVRDAAENGASSMASAVESVEAIHQSARRMNEIISVIDSLAFQTNILALNAAVEAARAGEQGRGFGVVATEVRNLARRSGESAREIRQLIQASTHQVETGVSQIRAAGDGMTQVVSGIRGVAANMSHISSASAEQSNGLSEISTAVSQLDEITQRNAQMVERAVAEAHTLESRAAGLARAVSGFRLQQGTAEEAMALVERAASLRERSGSRDQFVRALNQSTSGLHDRDMYVFALDTEGTYVAFAGNPAKVSSSVHTIAGIDGAQLMEAIVRQASEAPGWVEYDITNPSSGSIQTKMSYVCRIDDLYVGCGVYKNLVQLQAA